MVLSLRREGRRGYRGDSTGLQLSTLKFASAKGPSDSDSGDESMAGLSETDHEGSGHRVKTPSHVNRERKSVIQTAA